MTEDKRDDTAEDSALTVLIVVAIALLWLLSGKINQALSAYTAYADGIDLIYLPAGIRLVIVLIFRTWGAVGITVTNPILFMGEFDEVALPEILVNSLICGFVPLLAVTIACPILRIDKNLKNFRSIDIPLLALAVSVATPLAFNMQFIYFNMKSATELWQNLSAMILGDFIGCLLVLIVVRGVIFAYRKYGSTPAA